mmetsp:Transcript_48355/g.67188  ORF Transcript_48355/g.67188 Transcript_48355/m.67188 type:complete len:225 (+) Transcript_48355:224-898(+)
MVALLKFVENLPESLDEITTNGAAHATIVHNYNLLSECNLILLQLQQCVVDGYFSELIFDHRNLLLSLLLQEVVQEGCFAGSQEAGKDGDRQFLLVWYLWETLWCRDYISMNAEGVPIHEMCSHFVSRIQGLLVVLRVPKHLNLELDGFVRFFTDLFHKGLHLLHQLHDKNLTDYGERIVLHVDRSQAGRQLHSRMEPTCQREICHAPSHRAPARCGRWIRRQA